MTSNSSFSFPFSVVSRFSSPKLYIHPSDIPFHPLLNSLGRFSEYYSDGILNKHMSNICSPHNILGHKFPVTKESLEKIVPFGRKTCFRKYTPHSDPPWGVDGASTPIKFRDINSHYIRSIFQPKNMCSI